MNIESILTTTQDLRAQLDLWGITSQSLFFVGSLAMLGFLYSLRKVMSWFFYIQQTRNEIADLRSQIDRLQNSLNETQALMIKSQIIEEVTELPPEVPSETPTPETSNTRLFRFDH